MSGRSRKKEKIQRKKRSDVVEEEGGGGGGGEGTLELLEQSLEVSESSFSSSSSSSSRVIEFGTWRWEENDGTYIDFDPLSNLVLNVAAALGGDRIVHIMDGRYVVNLDVYEQANVSTGYIRTIDYDPPADRAESDLGYLAFLAELDAMVSSSGEDAPPVVPCSPPFFARVIMKAFMMSAKAFITPHAERSGAIQAQMEAALTATKRRVIGTYKLASRMARESGSSQSFSFGGSSGGGGFSASSAPSYGSDGTIPTPWTALGLLRYPMGGNGRERRDNAVRWVVDEIH